MPTKSPHPYTTTHKKQFTKTRTARLEPSDKTLLENKQKVQTKYYYSHARDLTVLGEGDVVQER